MLDVEWKRAVAAVIGANGRVAGTAFFVGPDLAMTCDHVLRDAGAGPYRLRAVGSFMYEEVIDDERYPGDDVALLQLREKSDRPVLPLSTSVGVNRSVTAHGFPRNYPIQQNPDGYPMHEKSISGSTTRRLADGDASLLVIGKAGLTNGMSGGPVVDVESGGVVGVLRFMEDSSGQRRSGQGSGEDSALAIPIATVVAKWPQLMPVDGSRPRFDDAFRANAPPQPMRRQAWAEFRPDALHCVVVGSEVLAGQALDEQLTSVVQAMEQDEYTMGGIWAAFREARRDTVLVNDVDWTLGESFSSNDLQLVTFTAPDAFTNGASLDLATRLLVEADLVLFDVTGFEPGVMLLLGIRAATRRGVSIASHGGGWLEGDWSKAGDNGRLDRPFNLSDLALSSHSPIDYGSGLDPRVPPLAERIRTAFGQLQRQPFYRDLPVYDALRQLGSQQDAWSTIPIKGGEVLVLCSYGDEYRETWRKRLRPELTTQLKELGQPSRVQRMQDIRTPQVVSQSLYERVRRCAGCVADWTLSSPSTFFELGVRLAVSPWSVVQIVDGEWLHSAGLRQLELMQVLFKPLVYSRTDVDLGRRVAEQLLARWQESKGSRGHRIRQEASAALGRVEERLRDLPGQLSAEADALSAAEVDQDIPPALFFEVRPMKRDRERAALERRLAAWFYLEHRYEAGRRAPDDPLHLRWRKLGTAVCKALYDAREADLADRIAARLEEEQQ